MASPGSVSAQKTLRELLDNSRVSRFQILVIVLCTALCTSDGFDILITSFAGPGLKADWEVSSSTLGLLLSASPLGMAVGSLVLSSLADRYGRRNLIIGCMTLATIGMWLSFVSTSPATFGAFRLVTGLSVGGLIAVLPVLTSEFSPARRRGTVLGIYAGGMPLGGVVAGGVATLSMSYYSWQTMFFFGGIINLILLILSLIWLPESLDYLTVRRPARALQRLNKILARMGHQARSELDASPRPKAKTFTLSFIRGGLFGKTLLLWLGWFLQMGAYFFAQSWTPTLLEQSSGSVKVGISGGLLLNIAGVAASLMFAVAAVRFNRLFLTVFGLGIGTVAFVAMGVTVGMGSAPVFINAMLIGIALTVVSAGIFSVAPDLYPTSVRGSGVGVATAFARAGAIVAPYITGVLVSTGLSTSSLFVLFAIPVLASGICFVAIRSISRRTQQEFL